MARILVKFLNQYDSRIRVESISKIEPNRIKQNFQNRIANRIESLQKCSNRIECSNRRIIRATPNKLHFLSVFAGDSVDLALGGPGDAMEDELFEDEEGPVLSLDRHIANLKFTKDWQKHS